MSDTSGNIENQPATNDMVVDQMSDDIKDVLSIICGGTEEIINGYVGDRYARDLDYPAVDGTPLIRWPNIHQDDLITTIGEHFVMTHPDRRPDELVNMAFQAGRIAAQFQLIEDIPEAIATKLAPTPDQ